jgi:2-polyprenyl-3-methyl-5-hydroxy-6-metoxy-1,4-benzoquinol methylase
VDWLLTQQIREVEDERRARDAIPRLTAIKGEIETAVRRQYEENPYPRWIAAPSPPIPMTVDDYVRGRFPLAPFRPLGDRDGIDVLVAGCGTGEHSIGIARRYKGAKVLAIDLSLSSLTYAQRKTRELGLPNIEYAQADVLALGSIGRFFDVIDASGVLHHLSDPVAGWRALLSLLRPGGLMRIGLYSERGRADIVAARQFIAEGGFDATAADIRRCRQQLLATSSTALTRYADFFSISGCRDLLFHVQEHRLAIPQIKEFLDGEKLVFLGFELHAGSLQDYRMRFPTDRTMTDLQCWDTFERERPATFAGMYQFWCQGG